MRNIFNILHSNRSHLSIEQLLASLIIMKDFHPLSIFEELDGGPLLDMNPDEVDKVDHQTIKPLNVFERFLFNIKSYEFKTESIREWWFPGKNFPMKRILIQRNLYKGRIIPNSFSSKSTKTVSENFVPSPFLTAKAGVALSLPGGI